MASSITLNQVFNSVSVMAGDSRTRILGQLLTKGGAKHNDEQPRMS